ncbi:MAG: RluA family pseudouridine synthase [Treponema sp.]|jgi:23S rRNA pseudouridine955/2504/2580 synthase|nr:RluA family pseudouridine synthase [Treponema sp.]
MDLITGENDNGRRLDRILRKALPDQSLPLIHRLIRQKKVLVNGKPAVAGDRIVTGATISIPSLKGQKNVFPLPKLPAPEIIWQGSGLLAVNKPAGLSVHGHGSLDSMVRSYLTDKLSLSLSFKPGPLHRLDKPSSGIVVFSTSLEGARLFSLLMRERKVKKTYLAVVEGKIKTEEIWQDELVRDRETKKTYVLQKKSCGSKEAVTKVMSLATDGDYSLIKAEIATGRTHQIRAQSAEHGHPLAGDVKYGGARSSQMSGFFLHAWKIEFLEYSIEAPPPLIHGSLPYRLFERFSEGENF